MREEDGLPGQDIAPTAGMANDLDRLEEALSEAESNELGANYERIKELLQRPYGTDGVPDARTLKAMLEMPREAFMTKIGLVDEE